MHVDVRAAAVQMSSLYTMQGSHARNVPASRHTENMSVLLHVCGILYRTLDNKRHQSALACTMLMPLAGLT